MNALADGVRETVNAVVEIGAAAIVLKFPPVVAERVGGILRCQGPTGSPQQRGRRKDAEDAERTQEP
jgi:hypothetical protein